MRPSKRAPVLTWAGSAAPRRVIASQYDLICDVSMSVSRPPPGCAHVTWYKTSQTRSVFVVEPGLPRVDPGTSGPRARAGTALELNCRAGTKKKTPSEDLSCARAPATPQKSKKEKTFDVIAYEYTILRHHRNQKKGEKIHVY